MISSEMKDKSPDSPPKRLVYCPFCNIEIEIDNDHLALAVHIAEATDQSHHRNNLAVLKFSA